VITADHAMSPYRQTRADTAYVERRDRLTPAAAKYAAVCNKRVRQVLDGADSLVMSSEATRIEQLAFANEMQRQAYRAGLIDYDPTKGAYYRNEHDEIHAIGAKWAAKKGQN
jgi:hypothetical protein